MSDISKVMVATAQYPIGEPRSLAEWQSKIRSWVATGAATGAQLLVFPEYAAIEQASVFGREVTSSLSATLAAVADLADTRIAFHAVLAKEFKVHMLVGSGPVRGSHGSFVNAAQLITPTGAIGSQEKMIMTPFERDWGVVAGQSIRVFETEIGKIGIAICYDSEFPLLVRAMAEAGADMVLVPSCTERISGFYRIRAAATARALENQVAVITSPTVGEALWSAAVDINTGSAGIFVPPDVFLSDTGIIAEGGLNLPCWITGEINFQRLRKLRTSGEMRNFVDWEFQPGAISLSSHIELVSLITKV